MTKLDKASIVGTSEVNVAKGFIEEGNISDIIIIPFDDGWDAEKTKAAYEEIKKQNIDIIITSHVSKCAMEIADKSNRDKKLTIVTGATTNLLSDKDDLILRVIQDVEQEQASIAGFITQKNVKKILVVRDTDNDAYTVPAYNFFKKNLKDVECKNVEFSVSKMDMSKFDELFKNNDFDLLYILVGGYKSNCGSLAQLAYKYHPDLPILYTPWMKSPRIIETAGNSIKNSIMPSHYPPRGMNKNVDNFIDKYKQTYNIPPTYISLNVRIALEILHEAIDAGNKTPESIKEYILKKSRFKTSLAEIEFNKYGDTHGKLYFITDIIKEF